MPHKNNFSSVLLWKYGPVTCTSRTVRPDSVEVTLTNNGIVVQQITFPDAAAASEFAAEKMRIYQEP
jgi:hypothetical protein